MVPFRLKTVGAAEFSPCSPTRQSSQQNQGVGVWTTFQDVFKNNLIHMVSSVLAAATKFSYRVSSYGPFCNLNSEF